MLALWAVNGFAQSAGWPLVIQAISNWNSSKRRGTVIGLLSTCYQIGNVLSWLLAGFVCADYGWRAVFWVPGLILLPIGIGVAVLLRNTPEEVGFASVRDDLLPDDQRAARGGPEGLLVPDDALAILKLTLSNRILWILGLGYFCMNSVRYTFMNWTVQYMADFHGRTIKGSAFIAIAIPLIGAISAMGAGWASDHFFGKRRAPLCALMLFGLAAVCVGFVFIPQGAWIVATVMLGIAGFLIYGPDVLMSGAATVDVSHPKAASAATGLIMCLGATGTIFSGVGIGWLKDTAHGQWGLVFWVLAALAVVSAMLMVSIWNARPRAAR